VPAPHTATAEVGQQTLRQLLLLLLLLPLLLLLLNVHFTTKACRAGVTGLAHADARIIRIRLVVDGIAERGNCMPVCLGILFRVIVTSPW
jgi:hypothetical protein